MDDWRFKIWFSSACTFRIVPYTIILMTETLARLVVLAMKAEKEDLLSKERDEAEVLLRRWVVLNGVRSLFPLIDAVVTAVAILKQL